MKRYLEKAYAKATPFHKTWNIIEILESGVRDYITYKSDAGRERDEKRFALFERSFGPGSSDSNAQPDQRRR